MWVDPNRSALRAARRGALCARRLERRAIDSGIQLPQRFGEIDLIASRANFCLIEVKTRRQDGLLRPAEAVTRAKQHKIIRTAYLYLERFPTRCSPALM